MCFDDKANIWDTEQRIFRANILSKEIIRCFDNEKKEKTALEIGAGTGLLTLNLKNNFKFIDCVEPSNDMVNVLKNKIKKLNINNINILDNVTKKYDVIYSSMVFHHILDIKSEFEKLKYYLKEDGVLIIIDLDEEDGSFHRNDKNFYGHNGFNREEFKKLLIETGYEKVKFKNVFKGVKNIENEFINYTLFLCLAKLKVLE